MEEAIKNILVDMDAYLTSNQSQKLQRVLILKLGKDQQRNIETSNMNYLRMFLDAKKIEGCSTRTIDYYQTTIEKMLCEITEPIRKVTTDDIRSYLSNYQDKNGCSRTTIDNIRRNISSFFTWLEEEDYIIKSPMRRIHKIKTKKTVKEIITDEEIEKLRDQCENLRDLAIIDLLYSTGIRIGELVRLNIGDINFEERECVVFGKGDKERRVYFDARTKIHLQQYINSRKDENPALFATLDAPYERLRISGVEIRLRGLGRQLGINRVHPHKFRRTMATRAIDKGMPIEQVQRLLGHSQIDTTKQHLT